MHSDVPPRRRTTRLRAFDYRSPGAYFVTICAFRRECLFGEVREGRFVTNAIGAIVAAEWSRLPLRFAHVELGTMVVMPNHIHGIVFIKATPGAASRAPTEASRVEVSAGGRHFEPEHDPGAASRAPTAETQTCPSLSAIVGAFKSLTTLAANRQQECPGRTIWQRGFHDHVVRDEEALRTLTDYIDANPRRWAEGPDHPDVASRDSQTT